MQAEDFLKARQSDWERLNELLRTSQSTIQALSPEQVNDLGRLYRATTSDLALAQRDFPRHQVTQYLNQLVAQAHTTVYQSEPLNTKRIVHFITTGFPQTYREILPFTVVAATVFILAGLLSALSTTWMPETARWIVPAQAQGMIDYIERQDLWTDIPIEERPYASSFIMQNNIQVSFLAFASGILMGILTLWIMAFNGLLLGGITGLTIHYGIGFELWTFVIGHGVIELSVIFMAGGAGLMLGWSLIQPGLHRRRDALAIAARKSVKLIVGCVPLLIIAGLVEGFISPADGIPWPVKWGFGLLSGVLLYTYLLFAGRAVPSSGYSSVRALSDR
ncbi:MAG: stage II sporulation protein M [Chloroflexota bacterium]